MDNAVKAVQELISSAQEDVPEDLLIDGVEDEPIVDEVETEAVIEETDEEPANEEVPDVYTIASLSEQIEVEPEFLYGVQIPMDGENEPISIGDLKNKYQDVIRERDALSTKVDGMAEEVTNAGAASQFGQQVSQKMMQAQAHKEAIVLQYQQVDWNKLETDDPGQAALHRQKYQQAFNQAESSIQEAQQAQAQQRQAYMQTATTEMYKIIPEWLDVGVMKSDQDGIRALLLAEGVPNQAIDQISNPIELKMVRELMQLRAEKAAATGAVKKVLAAPKVLKGRGAIKHDKSADVKALKKKLAGASPSGRRKSETELARAILGIKQ